MRELGLPFWLAGGVGSPAGLELALAEGAAGIQVGTIFAFSEESGLASEIKRRVFAAVSTNTASVLTDPRASPTGYPFKVVELPTHGTPPVERKRVCDLGYLRVAVQTPEGRLTYRCPAEPIDAYLGKGGELADTVGRRCLCNGLMSDVGLGQIRDGVVEPELITSGDDLSSILAVAGGAEGYSAVQALNYLLGV